MSQVISHAIKSNFIFIASSLLGIFPFRVIENELKVDNYLIIYSLIIPSCIKIGYLYFVYFEIHPAILILIQIKNGLTYFVSLFIFLWQSVTLLLVLVFFYFHRNALVETVDSLNKLVPVFRKLQRKPLKIPIQKGLLFENFIIPLLCGTTFYISGNTGKNVGITAGVIIDIIFKTLVCSQFNSFVDTVSELFHTSSKFLKRIQSNPFKRLASLERLVDALDQVVTTSSKINTIYSKILFIVIVNCYACMSLHLYYVYFHVTLNNGWRNTHIVGDAMMLILQVFFVWRLAHSAVQAKYKYNEFNAQLYQLMLHDKTNKITDNSKLALHISMQKEVEFSVCGWFNLDCTLLHSMIASATIYLFILIQFSDEFNVNLLRRAVTPAT
ncbi:Gustatory receptor 44 [Halyomorpha halys]|nr:Gustatory receptor 44 [Halyomorpha halys]